MPIKYENGRAVHFTLDEADIKRLDEVACKMKRSRENYLQFYIPILIEIHEAGLWHIDLREINKLLTRKED